MVVVDQLIASVGIDDSQIPRQLGGVKREIGEGLEQAAKRGAAGVDQAGQALLRQESAALRDAQALARFQAASGNAQQAAQTLRDALDNATAVQYRHGLQVQTQIARYEQAATGAGRWNEALTNLNTVAQMAGVGVGVQQLVQFGAEASNLDRATDRSERTLQALAGSTQLYGEALATAREQQRLFGGTLAKNIDGLSGLVTVSRESGAELQRLVDISQRLSLKSPEQGILGARVALTEAFSGNINSLAMRFEIPKEALRALQDESVSASEKLDMLDQYLARVGITSEAVARSTPETTRAVNELGAAWEETQRDAGNAINEILAPAARGATRVLQFWNDLTDAARRYNDEIGRQQFNALPPEVQAIIRGYTDRFNEAGEAGTRAAGAWGDAGDAAAASAADIETAGRTLEQASTRGAAAQERLADAETRYREESASRAQTHADRLADITSRAAAQQAETQRATSERLVAIETQARDRFESTRVQGLERLAELERRQQQQSEDDQRQHADRMGDLARRLADVQADAARDAAKRQRDYARRLADVQRDQDERAQDTAERRGDATLDREERRAERRAQIEAQLAQATTEEARQRAQEALAAMEQENAAEDARIARQQAREDERTARDAARRREELERRRQEQEQEAAEALARKQAEIAADQAQQEAAYAAARARRQEEQTAARTELVTDLNGQLEEIKRKYQAEQEEARTNAAARITQIQEAAAQQAAAEAEGYATQETQRRAAYQRQTEELKRALGEQLEAAVTAQQALGQVSADTAKRARDEIARVYGFTPGTEAANFQSLLAGTTQGSGIQDQVARDYGVAIAGVGGQSRGGTTIGAVTIQVNGAGDPRQVALAVREELLNLQNQGVRLGFTS